MKVKVVRTSFFTPSSSSSSALVIRPSEAGQERPVAQAAWIIQRWWKQLHLKTTASESEHYVQDMLSLKKAQKDSFTHLRQFIVEPNTLNTIHKLLMHLEQTKDIVLPMRMSIEDVYHTERQFLAAYMIVTKSQFVFESPANIDALLVKHAEEMLKAFEALSAFMSRNYLNEANVSQSSLAEQTPATERMLSLVANERIKNDRFFIKAGREYLDTFHQTQMAYYETLSEWEAQNRYKLTQILIQKYLEIESHRFKALNSPDLRMLELAEGYINQQETLRKRVQSLLGEKGKTMLSEQLSLFQASLEANKWNTTLKEVLAHELALNPTLVLPKDACAIRPKKDIKAAIDALDQQVPNVDLILDMFEEIRTTLTVFTPNNKQQMTKLQQLFSREHLKSKMDTIGLQQGLHEIISCIFEQIQLLESVAHDEETRLFINKTNRKIYEPGIYTLLEETLNYIYFKMSQMSLEYHNFYLDQARHSIANDIVAIEQEKFQERLSKKQFNLEFILGWIDKFVSTPENYRLDLPILCSEYSSPRIVHALLIAVLQQSKHAIFSSIPETFYLDRTRIVNWHMQYQNLLYTVTALSYLESFCKDSSVFLSLDELTEEKKRLMILLETGALSTPEEKADDLASVINRFLVTKKELTANDKNKLTSLVEKACVGTNPVTILMTKRLGDQLSSYFSKGYLSPSPVMKKYGLETDIEKLGKEILPVLRLHTKVHGLFYHQQIEKRLWSPLYTALKQTTLATPLQSLLLPETEDIHTLHEYTHKLAFVFSGLALIQQAVTYSDMWKLDLTIKNIALRKLAESFGLIELIKKPSSTKDVIEVKLRELMEHIANEYELSYGVSEKSKLMHMLNLAKDEKSPGCKAFLDELMTLSKPYRLDNKDEMNPHNLIAEFKDDVAHIRIKAKEIVEKIKKAHLPVDTPEESMSIPVLHAGRM